MVLRLLLILMLAFASVPMPAAAHDAAMMMPAHDMAGPIAAGHTMAGMQHGSDRPIPVPASSQHLCTGCVPMTDWNAARIEPPLALPAPPPVARIAVLPLLPNEAPTPPPPRIA